MRRASAMPLTALIAWLLCACAPAKTQTAAGGGGNRLTQEQLAATNTSTLYDAISKLRPEWLSSRGPVSATDPTPTSVSVFMNGTLLGKVDVLRSMGALDVTDVRYWDAGQASARFGMGHPRGVIEVTRK